MCFGNLSPIASRTSTSDLPTRSLAAANPPRSGTVSRSHTMTLGCMQGRPDKSRKIRLPAVLENQATGPSRAKLLPQIWHEHRHGI